MKSQTNFLYIVLIVLSTALLFASCDNRTNGYHILSHEDSVKMDSIHTVETKRLLAVLIASYIKPQFFSLNSRPLDLRTISQYRLKDSLQHIDSAFCSSIIQKMELGEISNNAFRWNEKLIPRAIIVDFKMEKWHELVSRKLQAMAGGGLYFLSEPLFNKSYDLALIDYGFSCGDRCGNGRLILYKKIDGRWVEYKIFSRWIA